MIDADMTTHTCFTKYATPGHRIGTETSPAGSASDQLLRFIGPDQPLAVSGVVTFNGKCVQVMWDSMQPWVNQLFLW